MTTFTQNDYPVPRSEHQYRSNSCKICVLIDYRSPKQVSTKPFRMIFLQNSTNKCPEMISLHKKWGEWVEGALIVPKVFSSNPSRMCTYTIIRLKVV